MEVVLWIAAGAGVVLGLAGIVLPLLPGTPLLFGGLCLAAWLGNFSRVSVTTVAILGIMALVAWTIDFTAAAIGVKNVGASNRAIAGAGIGALLGIVAGLPGLVLGPIVGAMIGEWSARRNAAQATRAGVAAGIGFVVAVAAKLGVALAMLGVFAFAYFV